MVATHVTTPESPAGPSTLKNQTAAPKKKARIAEDTEMRDSGDESLMEDADEEMEEQDGPQIDGTRDPTV